MRTLKVKDTPLNRRKLLQVCFQDEQDLPKIFEGLQYLRREQTGPVGKFEVRPGVWREVFLNDDML